MSPFLFHHSTRRACRSSIQERGLLGAQPCAYQAWGVYVYSDDMKHPVTVRGAGARRLVHQPHASQDVWQVAYIGPIVADCFVMNGWVLLENPTPDEVTLVTGHYER